MYSIQAPHLDFSQAACLKSIAFGDVYFSEEDGLAETQHVFLDAVDLNELFTRRQAICIAETGFGTGLNFLAVLQAWDAAGRPCDLDFVSVEGYPLSPEQLDQAWQCFPTELARYIDALRQSYPPVCPGFHLRRLYGGKVRLLLLFGQADEVLPQADFRADAWFLDGFTPALNPSIWSSSVFDAIKSCSGPGTRFATFSAARQVKNALARIGATVTLRPGFHHKRDALAARIEGALPARPNSEGYAIIGAGIAGASLAQACRDMQVNHQVLEPQSQIGFGASGNPLALVEPRLSHALDPAIDLIRLAYIFAIGCYDSLDTSPWVGARGMLKLPKDSREAERLEKWARASLFPTAWMQVEGAGLWFPQAGGINPNGLVSALLKGSPLRLDADVGQLRDPCIWALGAASALYHPDFAPVLKTKQGQLLKCATDKVWPRAISKSGYMAQSVDQTWIAGASYQDYRLSSISDRAWQAEDTDQLAEVKQRIGGIDAAAAKNSWAFARASLRAISKDRNAMVGPLVRPDAPTSSCNSELIFTALGSRGFVLAPLLAQHLIAKIAGRASPLPLLIQRTIDTSRFQR